MLYSWGSRRPLHEPSSRSHPHPHAGTRRAVLASEESVFIRDSLFFIRVLTLSLKSVFEASFTTNQSPFIELMEPARLPPFAISCKRLHPLVDLFRNQRLCETSRDCPRREGASSFNYQFLQDKIGALLKVSTAASSFSGVPITAPSLSFHE